MEPVNWTECLAEYEAFLKSIDVPRYSHLRAIKTVEQDLPSALLPLEIYYRYYWTGRDYKDYDEVFQIYWREKLSPHIYDFIKQYFYGCSMQFVEEGFKARLYRIWMSILTQFHFQYLWNALFPERLASTPELDEMGLDALVSVRGRQVGIQIKKVSYRREVSDRRFTTRQQRHADLIVQVPYLVVDLEELANKINNPRAHQRTKEASQSALKVFNENFLKFTNGFVVFREEYLKYVYEAISQKVPQAVGEVIPYEDILAW